MRKPDSWRWPGWRYCSAAAPSAAAIAALPRRSLPTRPAVRKAAGFLSIWSSTPPAAKRWLMNEPAISVLQSYRGGNAMQLAHRVSVFLFLLQAWLPAPSCPAAERWSPYCINEGEGGQVIVSIAAGNSDPDFVMFGTDVGGLYRSTDGGAHWIATGAGFDALTGLDIAIDPRNADHVLAVGSSPAAGRYCGVYRSADKGITWVQVLADDKIHDVFDRRGNRQIVIDGSSYDASGGFCRRVYYSSGTGVCYTSNDGGSNWTKVPALAAKSLLAINSRNGSLFAAHGKTLYRSNDRARAFNPFPQLPRPLAPWMPAMMLSFGVPAPRARFTYRRTTEIPSSPGLRRESPWAKSGASPASE